MKYIVILKKKLPLFRVALLLGMLAIVSACAQVQSPKELLFPSADFSLTILHTNDTHSMFGGTTDKGFAFYSAFSDDFFDCSHSFFLFLFHVVRYRLPYIEFELHVES